MEERTINVQKTARYCVLGSIEHASRIWIVLHGYGQLARYFLHKFEGLEKELLIVAPEGLSRFYVDDRHRRVGATWMTKEDRENEIQDHVGYLDRLVGSLSQDNKSHVPVGVLGFSQGVATACRWKMLGKTAIDRVVLWGGSLPLEMDQAQTANHFRNAHVQIISGNTDIVVPRKVADQSCAIFAAAGVTHTLLNFEGGHELEPITLRRCLADPNL